MDAIVTRRFLHKRFWIATFLLLAALAASGATAISVLRLQAERTGYYVAFHELHDAATRLELELVRLSLAPEGAAPDRSAARSAFAGLLTRFRAVTVSEREGSAGVGIGDRAFAAGGRPQGVTAGSATGSASLAVDRERASGSIFAGLASPWGLGPDNLPAVLEQSLARLLRLSAPVAQGHGPIAAAERAASDRVATLMADEIRPMLVGVARELDTQRDRAGHRALLVLALAAGLGIAAIVVNGIVIFIPVSRAVMRSQAAIIAERDRAVQADTAKRNFLSVVSHELRTPMNGVLGFASLLLNSDLKPEHRKQVEIIQSSGKTLLALVNDLLDFSKLEAGSLQLEDEEFSIEEVVSDVVSLLRGAAMAKNLDMSIYYDVRLPEQVRGDSHRLRQVLTNLVGNAIKFTDSGSIAIEVREPSGGAGPAGGRELQVSVSDTGIGIPADQCERVFEQFTQVHTGARRRSEGTGLGLAICKQLVEMMGGRIWVESTPGAGSIFHVRIPIRAAEPADVETDWQADAIAALSERRILVVDDNAIHRRILRLQLESFGARIEEASGANEALSLLDRMAASGGRYDAAIIDRAMPETDGVELARQIRADRRNAGLPLMLSSSAGMHAPGEACSLGFDAVEPKPVLPRTLVTTLRCLLADDRRDQGGLAAAETPVAARQSARILLAEDNLVGRELVQQMLSRSRYRVDAVDDGLSAVHAVSRLPYDLVLMDIGMPIMGGIEAARRIRTLAGDAAGVPIIALKAKGGSDDVAGYHAAGMQNVVDKPIDRAMLLGAIDAVLNPAIVPDIGGARDTASTEHVSQGATRYAPALAE